MVLLTLLSRVPTLKVILPMPGVIEHFSRLTILSPPFDNPKIRQALLYAFNQKDFLDGVIGDPKWNKTCKAMFMCDTPYAGFKGFEDKLDSGLAKAPELLKEDGYGGKPTVLLHWPNPDV